MRTKEMKEEQLYEVIKEKLEEIIRKEFGNNFHLEVTAEGKFSNELKSAIPTGREIIFSFLRKARPDITGFVEEDSYFVVTKIKSISFIVVEIKDRLIELDDIYQIKKYAELFGAKYALLISTNEIPEEIKRLGEAICLYRSPCLPGIYEYKRVALVHFDTDKNEFIEWYEKNPFEVK